MNRHYILLPVIALMSCFYVQGQTTNEFNTATIRVSARSYGDSVLIRWAPSSAAAWELLNAVGYQVQRIDRNNTNGEWTTLNTQPVKPLSLEQMKASLKRDNKYAAIAAQALYGKTFKGMRSGVAPAIADQASLLNDRYAFTLQAADFSAPVARATGLAWVDRSAQSGEAYIYRVLAAQQPASIKVAPGSVMLMNEKQAPPEPPTGLIAIGADQKVELQWPRSQQGGYTAYEVEVSDDGKNFRSLTSSPYYSSLPDTAQEQKDTLVSRLVDLLMYRHIFIDSIKQNYKTYTYRIRGINEFAEWSAYSEFATVMGLDLTPPAAPVAAMPVYQKKRSIRLTWAKPVIEKDLRGYFVQRAPAVDGNFTLLTRNLLPPSETSFVDTAALEHGPNFYVITAVDTAGNYNPSMPVMGLVTDTTAPVVPTGLSGRIEKDGLVYLSWNDNREVDLEGYKVYYSHQPNQIFTQLTLYPDSVNSFVDSIALKTLTKKIYYRVVAVDRNNNHSEFSPFLELKKPDIVPPVPPVIRNVTVLPQNVQVEFASSSSTDAVSYLVMRRDNEGTWKNLARFRHDSTRSFFTITDTTVQHLVRYEYAAKTIDEDSLQSDLCTPAKVQVRGVRELPPIQTLKAVYDAASGTVKLNWSYKDNEEYYFILFRSEAGQPLERYQRMESASQEFIDTAVPSINTGYQYTIQAVYKNFGKATRQSKPISVKR